MELDDLKNILSLITSPHTTLRVQASDVAGLAMLQQKVAAEIKQREKPAPKETP